MNPTETIFCSTVILMAAAGVFILALIANRLAVISTRLTRIKEILANSRNLTGEGPAGLDAARKRGGEAAD